MIGLAGCGGDGEAGASPDRLVGSGLMADWPGEPKFAYRAVMLDVARRYHSVETLKFLIDQCGAARINVLQLHLTDDQNWMFPSSSLAGVESRNTHGRPAYTVVELQEVVAYAKARGVTVVPEIDLPGHSSLLVAHDPARFGIAGATSGSCVNFASAEVRAAIKTLLEEVIAVFPDSPYVHIGGDEAYYPDAGKDDAFLAAMARLGEGAGPEAVFAEYLGEICDWLIAKGKTPVVWEGFRKSEWAERFIPKETLVIAWEAHYYAPDQLVRDGWRVVNAGWDPLYVVDHYPGDNFTMAGVDRILNFDPYRLGIIAREPGSEAFELTKEGRVEGGMLCWWEGTEENARVFLPARIRALGHALWFGAGVSSGFEGEKGPVAERKASADAVPVSHLLVGAKVSAPGEVQGFEASKMVDGVVDRLHYWMAYDAPVAAVIELEEAVEVSEITVVGYWDGSAVSRYLVEGSLDGEKWVELVDARESDVIGTLSGITYPVPSQRLKALRVTSYGSSKFPAWTVGRIVEVIAK